jgi:predicted secreted protein
VQKEGHLPISNLTAFTRFMADSQLDSSDSAKAERTSIVRAVLWATVAIALIVGLVLFFRYTRLMTPLL